MRASPTRGAVALVMVGVFLAVVASLAQPLLALHDRLCVALLQASGIPVGSVLQVPLFPGIANAPVPVITVPDLNTQPIKLWVMVGVVVLILAELQRRIALARTFFVFLITLLLMAAGVIMLHPSSQFGSAEFATMWLRGELLIWVLLPFFGAGMFLLSHPNAWFGILWAALMQAYGFIWSAVRLAFGIGLMHYSGIVFTPAFWFAAGFLADLIYVVVFYSVAVQSAARGVWGRRAQ